MLSLRRHRQRGQVVVWVLLMLPLFLGIAGLSVDAGQIFDSRREAQNLADGAARVAATQIDVPKLRSTGKFSIDADKARQVVKQYLSDNERGSGWQNANVNPSVGQVTVQLKRQVPTSFLRIINVRSLVTISAQSTAAVCYGVSTITATRVGGQPGSC